MDRITAARVFVAIVDRGSLTAAADALDLSRTMVTRHLAQMEAWAGVRLLHRTTRRLGLTGAGDETLARCRALLEIADRMPDAAAGGDDDQPRGILRISCAQSLGQEVLAGAVVAYLRRHPQAAVDLQLDNRATDLVAERIDLAVRITNALDPNLIARRLGDCASVVCAAPAYLAAHGTPRRPQDLALHNCLGYSHFGRSLWTFRHRASGESLSVPVGGNLSANESLALRAATLEGVGIAQQPAFSVVPYLASGRLVALLPEVEPQPLGIHAIYTSRQRMPLLLRSMLDFLADWFAAAGPAWTPDAPARRRP